jgi:DNA-directed RNA polymerase subunit RPC12/RpoP
MATQKPRVNPIAAIVWLLRCYQCRAEFEVLRPPTAEVMAAAMESQCPHCSAKPPVLRLGSGNGKDMRPHDIVGLKEK